MASLSISRESRLRDQLKSLVGGVRERCVSAVCIAWGSDAEYARTLEDWMRSAERKDVTHFPQSFGNFESTLLTGLQKILYVSEAVDGSSGADFVVPPSVKLLQLVRQQFVSNIYKGLSGMVENAEKPLNLGDASASSDGDELIIPARNGVSVDVHTNAVDITNRVSI